MRAKAQQRSPTAFRLEPSQPSDWRHRPCGRERPNPSESQTWNLRVRAAQRRPPVPGARARWHMRERAPARSTPSQHVCTCVSHEGRSKSAAGRSNATDQRVAIKAPKKVETGAHAVQSFVQVLPEIRARARLLARPASEMILCPEVVHDGCEVMVRRQLRRLQGLLRPTLELAHVVVGGACAASAKTAQAPGPAVSTPGGTPRQSGRWRISRPKSRSPRRPDAEHCCLAPRRGCRGAVGREWLLRPGKWAKIYWNLE